MILASRLGVDMPELDTKGLQLFAFPLSDAGSLLTIGHLEEKLHAIIIVHLLLPKGFNPSSRQGLRLRKLC